MLCSPVRKSMGIRIVRVRKKASAISEKFINVSVILGMSGTLKGEGRFRMDFGRQRRR